MLERLNGAVHPSPGITIAEASFPSPFAGGLEYSPPARGTWNIVHTGMLLPEAHQIFVCAAGCLRGVVLTAAEMGAAERFSTIEIRENNVLEGDMEELIIDGVADILSRMPKKPRAVLLYTSCIHHFMSCDLDRVYRILRQRHPGVDFTDCYMNPIMRKSGLTPDQTMRRQLYSLLKPMERDESSVNIIGNDLPFEPGTDFVEMLHSAHSTLRDITSLESYDEYLKMASAAANIVTYPAALPAGQELEKRFGQKLIYLPQSFDFDEISSALCKLSAELSLPLPELDSARRRAKAALADALDVVGGTEIAIDYTAVPRVLELAKLLLDHGFNVRRVYTDSIIGEDRPAFDALKAQHPELMLYPTNAPLMRVEPRCSAAPVLAIGQKAAYFTGTSHFVNIVEGGGLHGFDGIARLAELMTEAYTTERDAGALIQRKALGCASCI